MTSLMDRDIRFLKGVGEKRAKLLGKLGVFTLGALLRTYPRQYEDWSQTVSIAGAPLGETCCVRATVISAPREHRIRKGLVLYKFAVSDGEEIMQITIFNNRFAAGSVKQDREYLFFGKVTAQSTKREMSAPAMARAETGERIRPIYSRTEGLSSQIIEKAVRSALDITRGQIPEILPGTLRQRQNLCNIQTALQEIHFPTSPAALAAARSYLIFEELFIFRLGLQNIRGRSKSWGAPVIDEDFEAEFLSLLPFSATGAQKRVMGEIAGDLQSGVPMSRLLQGDVGSGKTAVAAFACYTVCKNGFQSAFMAPTEILANQHYKALTALLKPTGLTVALLTGSTPAAGKKEIKEALKSGTIDIVVGTHALLQDEVVFHNLALVVTDEQHRFGVNQRAALASKGEKSHMLVMSATPIPRTLALIIYGDLEVSVLDELPPGRMPVETYVVDSSKRKRIYNYIKKHIDQGRQAYIVCPLVSEGDNGLAAAEQYAQKLQSDEFRSYNVGLLHGKMSGKQKDQVMIDFVNGEISLLIATTVIEVGVDVPNAVLMVIENAERFGLSQLHQLRGRVGRGQDQSTCILISDSGNEDTRERLDVMRRTNNGFVVADEDLKLRGPGDFFGPRQHGLPVMRIANMVADMDLLQRAGEEARMIFENDPDLAWPEHHHVKNALENLFDLPNGQGLN